MKRQVVTIVERIQQTAYCKGVTHCSYKAAVSGGIGVPRGRERGTAKRIHNRSPIGKTFCTDSVTRV